MLFYKHFALSITLALMAGFSAPTSRADTSAPATPLDSCDFRSSMRRLWEEHITWTRLFIISDIENLSDKSATTARLLKNQTDLGDAIVPFYGRDAGTKLSQLLKDHILIAVKVVDAAKTRDRRALQLANAQWVTNADEIAIFLAGANPQYWQLSDMKNMMHKHLDLTTTEATSYLSKHYAVSVSAYDQVERQALEMADMLSKGIMEQFPGAFR